MIKAFSNFILNIRYSKSNSFANVFTVSFIFNNLSTSKIPFLRKRTIIKYYEHSKFNSFANDYTEIHIFTDYKHSDRNFSTKYRIFDILSILNLIHWRAIPVQTICSMLPNISNQLRSRTIAYFMISIIPNPKSVTNSFELA